jgi:uncharacterized protein (DUF3084 family)
MVLGAGKSSYPLDYFSIKANRYEAWSKKLKEAKGDGERDALKAAEPVFAKHRMSIQASISRIESDEREIKDHEKKIAAGATNADDRRAHIDRLKAQIETRKAKLMDMIGQK